jgi:hypothetical protein
VGEGAVGVKVKEPTDLQVPKRLAVEGAAAEVAWWKDLLLQILSSKMKAQHRTRKAVESLVLW